MEPRNRDEALEEGRALVTPDRTVQESYIKMKIE